MNISVRSLLSITIVLLSFSLSGCGQKGPLKIETPQVVQEQEQEETQ